MGSEGNEGRPWRRPRIYLAVVVAAAVFAALAAPAAAGEVRVCRKPSRHEGLAWGAVGVVGLIGFLTFSGYARSEDSDQAGLAPLSFVSLAAGISGFVAAVRAEDRPECESTGSRGGEEVREGPRQTAADVRVSATVQELRLVRIEGMEALDLLDNLDGQFAVCGPADPGPPIALAEVR